jgi:tRNA-2-methylthio-N6-dimethylallyladenosine synthase
MNVYDSGRMADILNQEGYEEAKSPEDADVVVLNTCHIREKAAEKIYSELGRLRRLKNAKQRKGEGFLVVVAGCVAQAEGAEILQRAPVVDVVVGPQSYHHLPELLRQAKTHAVVDTEFPVDDKFDYLPEQDSRAVSRRGVSAFVTVQEGCDRFCTFCVVPYTRGAQVSRDVGAVVDEIRQLTAFGVREVTLIGQNVNAYNGPGADGKPRTLGYLLRHVADQVPDLKRLRYTTSHPLNMNDDLVEAHRSLSLLMPYLHLPVQTGSDRILGEMNRQHTVSDYRFWVDKVRTARPDIALSSDFIVGFPGETETDFRETVRLVEEITFAGSFSFKYSARPGTTAAERPDQVDDTVKIRRLHELQAILEEQRLRFNRAMKGRVVDVLLEKPGRHPGQLVGKTPYLQAAFMNTERRIGDIVPARVVGIDSNSLSVEEYLPGSVQFKKAERIP